MGYGVGELGALGGGGGERGGMGVVRGGEACVWAEDGGDLGE